MLSPIQGEAYTCRRWVESKGPQSLRAACGPVAPPSLIQQMFGARLGPGRGVGLEVVESLTVALKAHPRLGTKEVGRSIMWKGNDGSRDQGHTVVLKVRP